MTTFLTALAAGIGLTISYLWGPVAYVVIPVGLATWAGLGKSVPTAIRWVLATVALMFLFLWVGFMLLIAFWGQLTPPTTFVTAVKEILCNRVLAIWTAVVVMSLVLTSWDPLEGVSRGITAAP